MTKKVVETEEEKVDSSWIVVITIIVIIVLVGGAIFLSQFQRERAVFKRTHIVYKEYNFTLGSDGAWTTMIYKGAQPYYITTYYNPLQVENISYGFDVTDLLYAVANRRRSMYITLDPAYPAIAVIAFVEMKKVIGDKFDLLNIDARAAYSRADGVHDDLPIVTCDNATADAPVMVLEVTNQTRVWLGNNCIHVEGSTFDELVRVADRIVFEVLTIM